MPNPRERAAHRRARIISTALRLWGQRGYHAVALREIAREAVVTLASIDQHIGTKEALLQASLDSQKDAYEATVQAVQVLLASGRPVTVRDLTACLMTAGDVMSQTEDGRNTLLTLYRHRHDPYPEVNRAMERSFHRLSQALVDAFHAYDSRLSAAQVVWAVRLSLGTIGEFRLSAALVQAQLSDVEAQPLPQDRALQLLVGYVGAGLQAVLSAGEPTDEAAPGPVPEREAFTGN